MIAEHHIANLPLAFWPMAFGSLGMLLLGISAAVPVVIHLLSRRRYNEMAWAAMEYLLAAMRKNARRIQLEQLLLLIVRVMILLVLAFALSDASCSLSSRLTRAFVATGGTTHHVIVIDGSYSMQYRDEDQTRFERAKELAAALVQSSQQGDGFTLILLADPPRAIVAAPAYDPADVVDEINALTGLDGSGNLTATLGEVEKILETARKEHPRLTHNRVYFFSDLGRTTWGTATTDTGAGRLASLGQRATLLLLDLGEAGADNLAVTSLTQFEPYVTAGHEVNYQAQIKNFGGQKNSRQLVEFLVDDRRVDEDRVDLAPGEEASVGFSYRFEQAGDHVVEIRSAKDKLAVDDARWLSVPVAESLKVLCIAGKPGSARYVAWSLQPRKMDSPTVRAELASESALLERELSEYDCVFLCNVGRFGRDEAEVLYNYLSGGGGLVIFLGDQVLPDSYNLELAGDLAKHRILPARIGPLADAGSYRFDPGDYEHPIVDPFRGFERTGLLTTPVWRYYKLEVDPESQARVALRFNNSDPAIVEEPIERGRCILVATAASDASVDSDQDPPVPWTAISAWHSFPPLVHEMLAFSAAGRFEGRTVDVGQPFSAVLRTSAADVPLEVRDPAGQRRRVRMSVDGEDSHWIHNDTYRSGVYRAVYGPPVDRSQVFAVNVNTAESDLSRVDPQMLPPELLVQTQIAGNAQTAAMLSRGNEGRMFRFALMGLLALLFGETYLAWRFGSSSL
jgi:hypothetical protein